eukprot:scaffold83576_cov79-Cyclotella_meneghiniana.AAC.2
MMDHRRSKNGLPHSKIMIAVLNEHKLQSCNITKPYNGRHHDELKLARIRLLGNYININCMHDGVTVKMADLPASEENATYNKLGNRTSKG